MDGPSSGIGSALPVLVSNGAGSESDGISERGPVTEERRQVVLMPNAVFVHLKTTYPEINAAARGPNGTALRNCTSGWWEVSEESAQGVEYLFGVADDPPGGKRVVSAYRVPLPVAQWPVIPMGAQGAGRRWIPTQPLDPRDWNTATSWRWSAHIQSIRYGNVSLVRGTFASFSVP